MEAIVYRLLNSLKALASLVGAIATALSLKYTENETLTILVIVSTAILTWVIPNLDPKGEHQNESVQPGEDIYEGAYDGEEGEVTYAEPAAEPAPYDPDAPVYTDGPERGNDPRQW